MMTKRLILSCALALVASMGVAQSSAQAAGWRVNPAACPDLREDIRDSRITWSRRDLREDRRDRAVTVCPASAYTYVPAAHARVVAVPIRPVVHTGVYVAPRVYPYRYRAAPRVRVVNVRVH